MKRIFVLHITCLALLPLLLLSACGGGEDEGGGSSSGSSVVYDGDAVVTTLNGTVADGYLRDARVFLDRNRNRFYDNGEPMSQSTAGGAYSLEVNPGEGELYPVVVEVVAGQTIDEDTGTPVANDYALESLPGRWHFVSPLTTLVALERDKNPSLSDQQVELNVRSQLGVHGAISLFTDYIASTSDGGEMVVEYQRTHRVAQVVAAVMGQVRSSIADNVNAVDPSVVALIVSDQVLAQALQIKDALTVARSSSGEVDVVALIGDAVGEINMDGLNGDMVDRYLQRLTEDPEVWDMQPPLLLSQFPLAGDDASIDVVIAVVFDELLDETLLNNGIIEVHGPNGVVSGTLDYDADSSRLTFTPTQVLLPFSSYRVTIGEGLADVLGNPLSSEIEWSFTTIFDQLPPALPDFM